MIQQLVRSYAGPPERYGLPKPNHRFGEAHPTSPGGSSIASSTARSRRSRTSRRWSGSLVRFDDGSEVEADVVVYCTGYKITFPFFEEQLISAPDNHIELFRRVFHPEIPNVFFIGLLQPLGAIMPLAEAQGAWVGDYLLGDYALPSAAGAAGPTSTPTRRRCASATSPPSATRSRSTSTTTSTRSPRSAVPELPGPARAASLPPPYADVLSPQPLRRPLPDLQQDAARQRARRCDHAASPGCDRARAGEAQRAPGAAPAVRACGCAARGGRRRTATAPSWSRVCAHRPTRSAWPTRSPSPARRLGVLAAGPAGRLRGRPRRGCGRRPRACDLGLLPDRLSVPGRGR